jgi:hypothetical protein
MMISPLVLSSCYTANIQVGSGAESGVSTKAKNNYFLFGLAPGKQAEYKQMADNQENYDIQIQMTFVDGLLFGITFGIFTPFTVTVTK